MRLSGLVSGKRPLTGRSATGAMRIGAGLLMFAQLSGCATLLGAAGIGIKSPSDPTAPAVCDATAAAAVLSRWGEISGSLPMRIANRPGEIDSGVLQLGSPAGVAVGMDQLYILDTVYGQILRLDRNSQSVRQRLVVPALDPRARIHVDRALSLYLANAATGNVLQFDLDGRLQQTFADPSVLTDPVGLAVADGDGSLYVGDALTARVVVFNAQGSVQRIIGDQMDERTFMSVRDVAMAPDQLFVLDDVAHQVHLLSAAGRYRYAFGEEVLIRPESITLDGQNRVYVADNGDNTIKIFRGGELISVFGESGNPQRVRLGQMTSIWASQDLLYVADAESVSIKMFRIAAPCDS